MSVDALHHYKKPACHIIVPMDHLNTTIPPVSIGSMPLRPFVYQLPIRCQTFRKGI